METVFLSFSCSVLKQRWHTKLLDRVAYHFQGRHMEVCHSDAGYWHSRVCTHWCHTSDFQKPRGLWRALISEIITSSQHGHRNIEACTRSSAIQQGFGAREITIIHLLTDKHLLCAARCHDIYTLWKGQIQPINICITSHALRLYSQLFPSQEEAHELGWRMYLC